MIKKSDMEQEQLKLLQALVELDERAKAWMTGVGCTEKVALLLARDDRESRLLELISLAWRCGAISMIKKHTVEADREFGASLARDSGSAP